MFRIAMIVLLVLIVLLGVAPIIVALGVNIVAGLLGCQIEAVSIQPCSYGGTDIGGALHTYGMSPLLLMFTVPIALVLLTLWLIFALPRISRRRKAS